MDERKFEAYTGAVLTNRKYGHHIFSCLYRRGVCTRYVVGNLLDGFVAVRHLEDDSPEVYQHKFNFATYATYGPRLTGAVCVPIISAMIEGAVSDEQFTKTLDILDHNDKICRDRGDIMPGHVKVVPVELPDAPHVHLYKTCTQNYLRVCAWGPWFGQEIRWSPVNHYLVVGNAAHGMLYWNAKAQLVVLKGAEDIDTLSDLRELYSEPIKHLFKDYQFTRDLLERL